jgi:hypothetical protein
MLPWSAAQHAGTQFWSHAAAGAVASGEDELRKVLERIVNSAKHAAASTPQPGQAALAATTAGAAAAGASSKPAPSGTATAMPAVSGAPGSKVAPAASAGTTQVGFL